MANLKGSTHEKQHKDAVYRLSAFGKQRHGTNSHKTHSEATRVKREMYFKDIKEFAEEKGLDGKLNTVIDEENLTELFDSRLDGLAYGTQEDYIRGWSGLVQGLQQCNITINVDVTFFDELVAEYKEDAIARGEDIGVPKLVTTPYHPNDVINLSLSTFSTLAQLQYETGYRVSEAYEVIQNLERYLDDMKLHNVKGKGGQKYHEKIISLELKIALMRLNAQIQQGLVLPVQSTYYRQLQKFDMSSHDIRAFYAKELYEEKLGEGLTHKEACLFVSKEINHKRPQITEYYLAKFGGN